MRTGRSNVANHVHVDGAQSLERHVRGNITELRSQHALHVLLHFAERLTGNQDWARFGKRHTPFAVHSADEALRNASPEIDRKTIAGTNHVVRPDGQVHWDVVGICRALAENIQPEPLNWPNIRSSLYVKGVQRRDIG